MSERYDKLASRLNQLLPQEVIDAAGRTVQFIRRLRKVEAWAFVCSIVLSRFSAGVPGFEAARQRYQQLTGDKIEPRPFHLRFKTPKAAALMERAFGLATEDWRGRRAKARHALARYFGDVVICDSSLVHLPDNLQDVYKGMRKVKAQLKVFLTISVFGLLPLDAEVEKATFPDQKYSFRLNRFRKRTLWLFDKGFVAYERLATLCSEGHFFLCPMAQHANPLIQSVNEGPLALGKKLRAHQGTLDLRSVLPRGKRIGRELDVNVLLSRSKRVAVRLVILRGPNQEQRPYLTNLPPETWKPTMLRELYRLRWQVELVFKELKQHLQLEAIPTKDPYAALTFVWASLIALALSRAVATWLAPLHQLSGLASALRVSLVSRALKPALRLLVAVMGGKGRCSAALVTLIAEAIHQEATNYRREREDSLARLAAYLQQAANCAA